MKGIRNFLLSLFFIGVLCISPVETEAARDKTNAYEAVCEQYGGQYIVGEPLPSDDPDKECFQVRCSDADPGIDQVQFNDVSGTIESVGRDEGAAVITWKKSCTESASARVRREQNEAAERRRARREAQAERDAEEAERERRSRDRQDRDSRRTSDRDSDGDYNGRRYGPWVEGQVIIVGGKRLVVGSDDFYKRCMNKSGSDAGTIKKKCTRGGGARLVISGDYDDGDRGSVFEGEIFYPRSSGPQLGIYYIRDRSGRTLECSSSMDIQRCLRDRYGIINARVGDWMHCSDCSVRGRSGSTLVINSGSSNNNKWGGILSGVAELAGAVAPPLFGYLGVRAQANAFENSQVAWANAQATGYEQCALLQQNYVDSTYQYIQNNELPDREVGLPGCNGFGLGQFAGGGGYYGNGFGGFGNAYYGGGYSPGFIAGMYGPGAGINLGINANSGLYNPYAGLGGGGFGFGIGGGIGMPGLGMGGINTGYNAGAQVQCITYPCPGMPNGGFTGGGQFGYPGYNNGGFTGGIGIGIGGNVGGFPGYGNYGSGYGYPGYGTPYGGGYGSIGLGTVPWGHSPGSYWGNNGGFTGGGQYGYPGYGYNNGGSINGNQFFSVQAAHQQNYAAAGAGSYYQQAALQNQMQGAAYNSANYAGGYNPAFSPMNAGFGLSGGFNFGF